MLVIKIIKYFLQFIRIDPGGVLAAMRFYSKRLGVQLF